MTTILTFPSPQATAGSGTSPPASGPSVSCVGVDSDWYCPHGYTCIYSDEGCAPPPGSGNAPISSTDLFTSNDFTSVTSTPMFVETSTAAIESPTTSFGTTNSAASPTGGSGTTTSSSAAAASPTKADGKSGPLPNTVWALGSLLMAAIAYTAFL
ncbi:hypothetical protein MMC19_003882 [Ptychographa xylographoides]|nr:hypothetical protein [Ptychographa xylographoides]